MILLIFKITIKFYNIYIKISLIKAISNSYSKEFKKICIFRINMKKIIDHTFLKSFELKLINVAN